MDDSEVIHRLELHAGLASEIEYRGTQGTFVGMLRPFSGRLDRAILADVLQAGSHLAAARLTPTTRLRAARSLVELVNRTRAWALDPDAMLTRNKLLSESQRKRLLRWVRQVEELAMQVLEGGVSQSAGSATSGEAGRMKVSVSQIYIKPGVNFPFSCEMQRWLSRELSSVWTPTRRYLDKYGDDFDLIVNVSALREIDENVVKGPTVFKKRRDVEYTVFLPFDVVLKSSDGIRTALKCLLAGIRSAFLDVGLLVDALDEHGGAMISHIVNSPGTMLDGPWPAPEVP